MGVGLLLHTEWAVLQQIACQVHLYGGLTFQSALSKSLASPRMGGWIFSLLGEHSVFLLRSHSCDGPAAISPMAELLLHCLSLPPSSASLPLFAGYSHPALATTPNSEYFRLLCTCDHCPAPRNGSCSTSQLFPTVIHHLDGKESRGHA